MSSNPNNIDISHIPIHVAIIPDGNRRWAKEKGLKPWEGHQAGEKALKETLKAIQKLGIKHLSFWGSSLDNIAKRPKEEVLYLLKNFEENFAKLADNEDVHKNKIRVNVIGRWNDILPDGVKNSIKKAIDATKNYSDYCLNFFIAYDGLDEMKSAIKNIIASGEKEITDELVKKNLYTAELPPVDYLIRTGGEPHLSAGFMMWDTANTQLYFSEKMYPDFGGEEFTEAIEEYKRRQRRFGG